MKHILNFDGVKAFNNVISCDVTNITNCLLFEASHLSKSLDNYTNLLNCLCETLTTQVDKRSDLHQLYPILICDQSSSADLAAVL